MEDERIVPFLVSVYKAEVLHHFVVTSIPVPWREHHLVFAAWRVVGALLQLYLMLGRLVQLGKARVVIACGT